MRDISSFIGQAKSLFKKPTGQQIPVIGVDLSHHYVRFSQLDQRGSGWVLVNMASRAIDSTIIDDAAHEIELVKTLSQLHRENAFNTDKVAVSLPITSAIVKVINIPILKEDELKRAVDNGTLWANSIQLPEELSHYSIFWQVLAKDETKNQMSVLFVASKKAEIDRTVDILARAGLDALVVDVRCFALRNILRISDEKNPNTLSVFLEISGDENYIIYIDSGMPYIYDIYVSDSDVSTLKAGDYDHMELVFQRLSDQIRASMQSFIGQSGRSAIEHVNFVSTLTNAQALLNGLKQAMPDFSLKMANPFEDLLIPEHLKDRVQSEKNKSSFTASVGLATRRLDIFGYFKFVTAVSNINLLPNREERMDEQKRKVVISDNLKRYGVAIACIGFVALLTSVIADLYSGTSDRVDLLKQSVAQSKQQNDQLQAEVTAISRFVNVRSAKNQRILTLKILQGLPRTILVKEMKVNAEGLSSVTLVSRDAGQFSLFVASLSQNPDVKSPKLESVEVESAQAGQRGLQVGKISFMVK